MAVFGSIPAFGHSSFLFFSFVPYTFGVWGPISLLIIDGSAGEARSARNVFLFLAAMSVVFYGAAGIRELSGTRLSFNWRPAAIPVIVSIACGAAAYLISLCRGGIPGALAATVPMAAMAYDAMTYFRNIFSGGAGLAPALVNSAGYIYCAILFFPRQRGRLIAVLLSLAVSAAYFINI